MADHELLEAFNDCIDRIADGQSINDCLRRYPQFADALRPMLEVGKLIERVQVSAFEVATAQMRVRARVSEILRKPPPARRSYMRFVALAASLLITFAALFGAAENSLPGDPLYGIKRLTENVRSAVIGDQFGQRRLDEVRILLALRRSAEVEFTGEVEQIDGSNWRISSINLQVSAEVTGAAVGDRVHINGYTTEQGQLVGVRVQVLEKGEPPLLPTLAVLPSVTSTQTTTNTPSATAAPTATPTPSPTLLLTSTAIPSPTICATMQPQGWVRYVVQSGDTVGVLAAVTGTSVEQVLAVNCLPETQMIIVGQTLFLPSLPPTLQPGGDQSITSTPDDDGGDDHGGGSNSGSDDHGGSSGPD